DVVIMDPPRAGSDRNFIKSVLTLSPKKVVYVSCNPETLARDLRFFVSGGYKVRKAVPVDMFPHTKHVETVVQLVRKNPDTYIDITVDKDELDLISSEAKATYEEIKDYIFERFGLKVSSLNIAQVKTKCGIIERGNYNKPKSENTKQPQCTKNKEEAIMNALRHFKMI
ncbi:MAG TPA: 23S rRNA (uracil(1939)-C(5))-methyltransferase RlmD, partial [Ruminococcaceae bacterium]|nr:23S rRNA (uracil(1939)-C(5))-methyltransferase RlmD [Oscillospiraceae bacterium]